MRIAFIIGRFPSLSETFILNQIIGLKQLGHHVHIYAQNPDQGIKFHSDIEKYDLLGITSYYPDTPANYFFRMLKALYVFALNTRNKNSILLLRSLNFHAYGHLSLSLRLFYYCIPFLKGQKSYDVINCHFGHLGIVGVCLRDVGALQGKISTTFHGWDMTELIHKNGKNVYSYLFKNGDLFLPVSEYWKNKLLDLGCPSNKISVHHMGIDCQKFLYSCKQDNFNEEYKVKIISIARLVEKKGIEYAIRAIQEVSKDNINFEYNIIGDGPLRFHLENTIEILGVGKFVKILGTLPQNEVISALINADLMLAPSVTSSSGDQEGIPVVLMEAMATGLPIISTFHSGIPELVEDEISGFLVPEKDIHNLAEKINYLINNPSEWSLMGHSGRKQIEISYNISNLNNALVDLFQRLKSTE